MRSLSALRRLSRSAAESSAAFMVVTNRMAVVAARRKRRICMAPVYEKHGLGFSVKVPTRPENPRPLHRNVPVLVEPDDDPGLAELKDVLELRSEVLELHAPLETDCEDATASLRKRRRRNRGDRLRHLRRIGAVDDRRGGRGR